MAQTKPDGTTTIDLVALLADTTSDQLDEALRNASPETRKRVAGIVRRINAENNPKRAIMRNVLRVQRAMDTISVIFDDSRNLEGACSAILDAIHAFTDDTSYYTGAARLRIAARVKQRAERKARRAEQTADIDDLD